MTIIIANNIHPSVRGMLKRWFIEPKPNVFVGSVNTRTREKTISYLRRNAVNLSMLVIFDAPNSQGFTVFSYGDTDREFVRKCGLELVLENPDVRESENTHDNS